MRRRLGQRFTQHLRNLADARSTEGGFAAIMVAILCASGFLLAMCAITIDTSRWYDEISRVQKAADQAALAGVPYLPQDLTNATLRAKDVAKRNGYDDASAQVVVKVEVGELPSRLKVTITSTIENTFGGMIGVSTAKIQRTATADYKGPAPMGSPCNTFGNEPNSGSGTSSTTPAGTSQGSSPFSNCSRTPVFWANIEGPETGKVQGDRYQTRNCEISNVDGCVGTSNIPSPEPPQGEYDEFGYVFTVKVQPAAVNKTIDVQLYDPQFAFTGQYCEYLNTTAALQTSYGTATAPNNYMTNAEARVRYSKDAGAATTPATHWQTYCNGDSFPGNGTTTTAPNQHKMTTSFVLRQQTDSQDPKAAPVQNDTTGTPCIKQYGGWVPTASSGTFQTWSPDVLNKTKASYNDDLAKLFHNWSTLCKFTPTRAGDYYLQVRTNVAYAGTAGTLVKSNVAAAAALTGNTTSGEGSNSFAIRAVTPSGSEKDVAVSGYSHMPIWINTDAASATFNLIRVLPGAAGQYISFSYFDAGDSQSAGSVKVLPPSDATGSITSTPFPGSCKAQGGSAGTTQVTISNCTAPFTQGSGGTSNNNGKVETITIPIPLDYNCTYTSFGGCWYRVLMTFGSGSVHDVTTWDATIVGDPVRLVH